MSFFTQIRDAVVKPALAIAAAPFTGGASMAVLAADAAAPAGSLTTQKPQKPQKPQAAPVPAAKAMQAPAQGNVAGFVGAIKSSPYLVPALLAIGGLVAVWVVIRVSRK